ncbi:MAG: Hsp20/alpha crystallin family protein [Betaproteobacteria bacterium]
MAEPHQTCYDAEVAFTRWDPLRDLLALHEQIGQLVGTDAPGWTPPVDLYETAAEYVLTAELAGLSRDQIEIHAEDNRITLRGERASGPGGAGHAIPCEQYHRVERGHGRFSRAFVLPEAVQVDAVRADLKDGVLTVTIPKAADRSTRKIDVS